VRGAVLAGGDLSLPFAVGSAGPVHRLVLPQFLAIATAAGDLGARLGQFALLPPDIGLGGAYLP